MFTITFWKAVLNRCIAGAASAVLVFLGVGTVAGADGNAPINAFMFDWPVLGGVALAGAFVQLLMSLAGQMQSGTGPSFGNTEVLNPRLVSKELGQKMGRLD